MRIGDITKTKSKGQYRLFGTEYSLRETIAGLSFLAPCFLLSVVFVFLPIAISLSYAFTDANMLRLDSVNFIGFDNFVRLFQDASIGKALTNTLIFVGCVIPLQFGTALGLALILNHIKRFNTFLRWAFFCPVMLSLAVTSMLWMNLLNPQEGLINALILALGGNPMMFLEDPDQAMGCIIFISAWQGAGYQMLILLSGLKNIPKELYEAAEIDGCSPMGIFFKIVLPLSKAALASIGLMFAVTVWNDYSTVKIYITNPDQVNFQYQLRNMIMDGDTPTTQYSVSQNTLFYAAIVCAILPFMALYPFLQKYFVKGVNIGAVKE